MSETKLDPVSAWAVEPDQVERLQLEVSALETQLAESTRHVMLNAVDQVELKQLRSELAELKAENEELRKQVADMQTGIDSWRNGLPYGESEYPLRVEQSPSWIPVSVETRKEVLTEDAYWLKWHSGGVSLLTVGHGGFKDSALKTSATLAEELDRAVAKLATAEKLHSRRRQEIFQDGQLVIEELRKRLIAQQSCHVEALRALQARHDGFLGVVMALVGHIKETGAIEHLDADAQFAIGVIEAKFNDVALRQTKEKP